MPRDSYLRRYLRGERDGVWRDLISLGPAVREEPVFSDAVSVVHEVVRRAEMNLQTLHSRLLELGYEFADSENALRLASDKDREVLGRMEREFGTMPLVLRAWYERFGSVDFRQDDCQLRCPRGIDPGSGSEISGLGSHLVLVFVSLKDSLDFQRELLGHRAERIRKSFEETVAESPALARFFPTGGWASNCEPKGFRLPNEGADAVLFNDGGGDVYFVDELRTAFQWGGFPFWRWSLRKPNFYSPMEFRPNFVRLLPFLKEGLLDL